MKSTQNNNIISEQEVVGPLKYVSNFWRSPDLPLIDCEIEIDLSWSKKCMIPEISIIPRILANLNANPPVQEAAVIYFPLVTLFIEDNIKFLENIK